MATFFGISSPMTIDVTVTSAKPTAIDGPSPRAGCSAVATVGCAMKPRTSELTVMPSCVPER